MPISSAGAGFSSVTSRAVTDSGSPHRDDAALRAANPGYYSPTDDEYSASWDDGLIAVDASVLLSLYRYSTKTRDELIKLLTGLRERLWLPHQAAVEYERNRLPVIRQQVNAYGQTLETFDKGLASIRTEFSHLARHPLLDQDELTRLLPRDGDPIASPA
jgi:hypothetical protein